MMKPILRQCTQNNCSPRKRPSTFAHHTTSVFTVQMPEVKLCLDTNPDGVCCELGDFNESWGMPDIASKSWVGAGPQTNVCVNDPSWFHWRFKMRVCLSKSRGWAGKSTLCQIG